MNVWVNTRTSNGKCPRSYSLELVLDKEQFLGKKEALDLMHKIHDPIQRTTGIHKVYGIMQNQSTQLDGNLFFW